MILTSSPSAADLLQTSPEYELVRLLACTQLSAEQLGRANKLVNEEIDWPRVLGLAGYHGVQSLFYANLKVITAEVPSEPVKILRDWVNARAAHALFLSQELGRLVHLFDTEGIRLLAIKGPVLAQHVYQSIALRPFVDLDLVIPPGRFRQVEAVLRADGFQTADMNPLQRALYLYVHRQDTFWKNTTLGPSRALSVIDLHTAMMPPGYSWSVAFEALWDRSRLLRVLQRDVHMPSAEDLIMVLCFHGFKNRWDRLKYVVDLAETLRVERDLDWDALLRRARSEGWCRVLGLGLGLCDRVAEVDVPPEVQAHVIDSQAEALAKELAVRMADQADMRVEPYRDRMRLNLLAQDSFRGQVRYAGYVVARRLSDLVLPASEAD